MTRSASWLTALVWKGEDLWRSCSKRLRKTIRYPDTNPIKKVYSDFLKRAWFHARVTSRYPDANSQTVVNITEVKRCGFDGAPGLYWYKLGPLWLTAGDPSPPVTVETVT